MFKISRKVEYSLIALKYLNQKTPGQLSTAKEISALFKIPFDPTSRVLQIMSHHKILKAEQGSHGGYQIQKDLSKVTLNQLSKILLGPVKIAHCLNTDIENCCEFVSECNVISPLIDINERIKNLFDEIPISELIQVKHSNEKLIKQKNAINAN